jgi:hypothetical protein
MNIVESFAIAQQSAPSAETGAILVLSVFVVMFAFVIGVGLIVRLVLGPGGDDGDDP